MINGLQIDYKLKKGMSSRFNQSMFGRITNIKQRRNNKTGYYVRGILDSIPHYRIFEGRIFISTCNGIPNFDPVMDMFVKFETASVSKDDEDVFMRTGKEKWMVHAKEKGVKIEW